MPARTLLRNTSWLLGGVLAAAAGSMAAPATDCPPIVVTPGGGSAQDREQVCAGAAAAQLGKGLGEMVNPFQAMTTVTVKIVSQLTGDTDFAAPETLVAFALGLTLFVLTLCLNVAALIIVRKYREQYE